MKIETGQFEFAHGKKPRGIGQWFFNFGHLVSGPGSLTFEDLAAPAGLSYGEAKQWAIAKARELDAVRVSVCS